MHTTYIDTSEIIDIHTHALPGVDDGSESMDETIAMLWSASMQGVTAITLTPHYSRRFSSRELTEKLIDNCKEVRAKARRLCPDLHIYLGQELRYHEELPGRLLEGAALTLNNSRYALVEFEPTDEYERITRGIRALTGAGYIPVLAHVERYMALDDPENIDRLKEFGTVIQMNYEAILGGIFDYQTRRAKELIRTGRVDLLASDVHRGRDVKDLYNKAVNAVVKLVGEEAADDLLYSTPLKLLGNKDLD